MCSSLTHKIKELLSAKEATVYACVEIIINNNNKKTIFTYRYIWLTTYMNKLLNAKQSKLESNLVLGETIKHWIT